MNYRINKTNPFDGDNLPIEEFSSNGPIHPVSTSLSQTATRASSSLLLFGRGHPNYGERVAENFVHLLENFCGPTEPKYPINGQIWVCSVEVVQTSSGWYVWDKNLSAWNSFVPTNGTPNTFVDGEFWINGSILSRAINQVDNPLSQTTVNVKYISAPNADNPTAEGLKPQIEILVYNNGTWVGSSNVLVSPVEPFNNQNGKLWFDSNENKLKIYLNNSYQDILSNYLSLDGGTMSGDIDMGTNSIINLPTPSSDTEAANKKYVDDKVSDVNPETSTLDSFSDVEYSGQPSDLQLLKWDDQISSWVPSNLVLSDISDVTVTGVVPSEIGRLVGLTQNINTKFSSLDVQMSNRLLINGSVPMTGNLSMFDPATNVNFRIRGLAEPALDDDAATRLYVTTSITSSENKLRTRYVTLTKTSVATIGDGLTPSTTINNYTSTDDPYGIASDSTGIIDMSGLSNLGTEIMVKLTAYVKWSSVTAPTGIRGIEIVGASNFVAVNNPLDGFDTTQYITTGPFSVGQNSTFSLNAFQNSGNAQDIEHAVLTFEIVEANVV